MRTLLLILIGALCALSFAPGPLPASLLSVLNLLCLAFLARLVLQARSSRRAAADGWGFGTGLFGVGLYWLYISMHDYGNMPAALAGLAVFVLAALLALYPALACSLTRLLAGADPLRRPMTAAFVWAACWTGAEWLRGTVLTGFPWLNAAYAHVDSPYAGWAPVLGSYGVAFMAALSAAALALLTLPAEPRYGQRNGSTRKLSPLLIVFPVLLTGWWSLSNRWAEPYGAPLQVRLVQGNIDQGVKFNPETLASTLAHHQQLSLNPFPATPPELIVLPETIVPAFQNQIDPALWDDWRMLARYTGATVILGAPLLDPASGEYANSVIGIDRDTSHEALLAGRPDMRYDKRHLVPFGEFVPPGFRWLVDSMRIPLGDFTRGTTAQAPFPLKGQYLAPNICYEDVFGNELLPALQPDAATGTPGATILVNVSNLGWFGDSWALRQHLQIARMRALETARPMLRATNTGVTAAIDDGGVVIGQLPVYEAGVLDAQIQGMTGLTPYARWADRPVLILCGLILVLALLARLRRRD
ncbi:apolipoprotein N-acyltransferase [Corticimicrobacter populi]|uniref:Apolipoprotein N-acyltransferase n=1 Tax=Corticimicrobacter populi TaxID=2175229 RepID=A0A2V1JZE8_9BURK|nr:apolipoprotein N-acyltransferase [Corticimicrobacter populi]PWF24179.1 apolipoprotein N-acyltransferase [Corticimicrobacter populi]